VTPPIRTCLGCRGRLAKSELIRLAWNNTAGVVVVDDGQVMPGRGCYVHPGCADQVARRKLLGRALRRPVDGEQAAALLAALAAPATHDPA
jgi:predicted RNA-binding protein YlxR (DUF448 family)